MKHTHVHTRATSLFLALVLVLSLILPPGITIRVQAAGGTLEGDGTVVSPYLIADADDLAAFRDKANAEASSVLCAKLTADIQLSGEWAPFNPSSGYVTEAYAGTFDGNFHTISGLSINDSSSNGVGLFGTVNGATIKNLKVEGNISASKSSFVGGIVGKTQGTATIDSCSFFGTVNSQKTGNNAGVGGIVGRVNAGAPMIKNCVNSGSITGGAAGGILGYCSAKGVSVQNCYNTGTITGSSRTGGIVGQVHTSTEITNCYTTKGIIAGFNGQLNNCYGETTPLDDVSKLGNAFTTDTNGNIVLTWQKDNAPIPKNPHIELTGGSALYMTNSGEQPTLTLSVQYIDIDTDHQPDVTWSIQDGSDIISLKDTNSSDSKIVQAVKPGKATVIATAGEYTAEREITVYPFVTTIAIDGTPVAGQMVKAKVNVLGGNEFDYNTFPELKFQWKYLTGDDYSAGNTGTSSYKNIEGATNREYVIPEDMAGNYLSFDFWYQSENKNLGRPIKIQSVAEFALKEDKDALQIPTDDIQTAITLILPQSGANGSTINWTSDYPEIINPETGAVTLPVGDDVIVELTANLTYQDETASKTFQIKVLANSTQTLELDRNALNIPTDDIQTAITLDLPTIGNYNSAISWTSNHPEIINPETGAVTLPVGDDVIVELTANLTYQNQTVSKVFSIRVLADPVQTLELDRNALILSTEIQTAMTLDLPVIGNHNSVISWTSDYPEIIDPETGVVALPETGTVIVVLTADLTYRDQSVSKEFSVQVTNPVIPVDPLEILEHDKGTLNISTEDIQAITTLTLPSMGDKGSAISWSSDVPEIINPKTGAVTLPETGTIIVTLTANLIYQDQSTSKLFTIRVFAPAVNNDAAELDIPTGTIQTATTLNLPQSGTRGSIIHWTSNYPEVINPETGAITLPETGPVIVTLTATLTNQGQTATKSFAISVDSDPAQPLKEAVDALGSFYKLNPVFGQDSNVNQMLRADLSEKGYDNPNLEISVKNVEEIYGGAGIDKTGEITYFYINPNATPTIKNGNYRVTFTLSDGNTALDFESVPVIIPWDIKKVQNVMKQEILPQVILDETTPVINNLTLPKVVDNKRWTLIDWTTSNADVISISNQNQTTADTLFDPYVGIIKRGTVDQSVTLTAAFHFQFADASMPITLYKAFQIVIPAPEISQEEQIRNNLLAKLNQGFDVKGLTDAVTGERLIPDETGIYRAINDIQFPTTRDFGVDGKYYSVEITSDTPALAIPPDVQNAARVQILRPGTKQPDGQAIITITLHDRDTSITAEKSFVILIPALTQTEVDAEYTLFNRVREHYFDGIKGQNLSRDNIRENLSPFQEVYENESGELIWVRDAKDRVFHGIIPTPIKGWEDLELWRLFKSSNPNVIQHETLEVTRQAEAKSVTITSYLSSETLGRYGQLYIENPDIYAQYADLAGLYYQEVNTDLIPANETSLQEAEEIIHTSQEPATSLIVRGTRDPESVVPVSQTLNVSFVLTGLDSDVWISAQTCPDLDESSTVYDLFTRLLTDHGCTAVRQKGTYIVSITNQSGVTLSEKEYGSKSGWMYRVNSQIPDVYMGACPLHDGDKVQVFYTRDASQDDPNWTWPDDENNPDNNKPGTDNPGDNKPGTSNPGDNKPSTNNPTNIPTNNNSGNINGNSNNNSSSGGGGSSGKTSNPVQNPTQTTTNTPSGMQPDNVQITRDEKTGQYSISLPKARDQTGSVLVRIPVETPGQLVMLVYPDGHEAVVRKSIWQNGTAKFLLKENATIRLMDYKHSFVDIPENVWYDSAVDFVTGRELFQGVSADYFAPTQNLSRAMLATILYRLENPENGTGDNQNPRVFSDVPDDAWYAQSIAWAAEIEIVSGYRDGRFQPNASVTREQLAVMLFRYAKLLNMSTGGRDSLTAFSDSELLSEWSLESLAWAVDTGIIQGRSSGKLDPKGYATRAETAVMLQRFVDALLKA